MGLSRLVERLKMQVRTMQVQICSGGKRKYGNGKSDLDAGMTENVIANQRNRYWYHDK